MSSAGSDDCPHGGDTSKVAAEARIHDLEARIAELQGECLGLRESEARFRKAQDDARYLASFPEKNPNPIVEADLNGRVKYANPAALRLFPDIHEKGAAHPFLGGWDAAVRSVRAGAVVDRLVSIAERTFHQAIVHLPEEGVNRVYGRDVTDRHRAEQDVYRLATQLAQQARTHESILAAVPDHLFVLDRAGRCVYANLPLLEHWGLTLDQAKGKTLLDLHYPPEAEQAVLDGLRRVVETGAIARVEFSYAKPGTAAARYETLLTPVRREDAGVELIAGSSRDLTERKRAEVWRRFQATLMESVSDAVVAVDPEFRITSWNAAAAKLYGWTAEEVLGRSSREVLRTNLSDDGVARLVAGLAATGDSMQEVEQARRDGSTVLVESKLTALKDAAGRITGYMGINRDVSERNRAQDAVRESEERYRLLFSNMTQGFALHEILTDEAGRPIDYRFLDVNPAFELLTGLKRSDLVGRRVSEVLPGTEPEWIERYGQVALTGEPASFESFSAALRRWYEVFAYRPAAGQFAVVFGDVTQRRLAQDAMRKSEERFRALAEALPQIVWTADGDGAVDWYNQRWYDYTGEALTIGEGWAWKKFAHPDDTLLTLEKWAEARRAATLFQNEIRVRNRQGEYRWFLVRAWPLLDTDGRGVRWFGTNTDIHDLKAAEVALRESRQDLARAQAVGQIGSWRLDVARNVLMWSDENHRIFGIPHGTPLTYETFLSIVHPEDRAFVDDRWRAALRGEPYDVEHRIVADGRVKWVREKAYLELSPAGELQSGFGITQDVTERKEMEDALRAANLGLAEANHRKNDFLAVLSHELRNPLAPIKNSLHLLQRAAPGAEPARRALRVIDRQVQQLSNLVNDLLDVTRMTNSKIRLHTERLELNEAVRRAIEDNRPLPEASEVRIEFTPSPEPVQVIADPTRLGQIVANLLQNAAKFAPPDGLARVRIDVEGSQAALRVSDNGVGMTPQIVAQLFQPFVQAEQSLDRSKGGLGLGLALVKGLVELHGGSVSAHSDGLGKGSTFVVRLPLDLGAAIEPATSRVSPLPKPTRVLLIEDNVDAAESLRDVLELSGHVVAVAHSGPEGLAKARESQPEVVLCDIGLPGMNGYEVAKAFRADPALAPMFLVALTGYALPEDLERATAAGFDQHVSKPPSLEALATLIARVAHSST